MKTMWEDYSDDVRIKEIDYDSPFYYYIGMNLENGFLMNVEARRLMAATIPYDAVAQDGFLGHFYLTTLPILPRHRLLADLNPYYGVNDEGSYYIRSYVDVDKTEYIEQLKSKGFDLLNYGVEAMTLIYNSEDIYHNKIIEIMEAEFGMNLITVNYEGLNPEEYILRLEQRDFDLYLGTLKTGLIPNLYDMYDSTGNINYTGYSSINMNGLLSTYRKVIDETQFIAQLENLSKVMADDLPVIPLGFLENAMFIHDQISEGATPTFFNLYHDFEKLEIVK